MIWQCPPSAHGVCGSASTGVRDEGFCFLVLQQSALGVRAAGRPWNSQASQQGVLGQEGSTPCAKSSRRSSCAARCCCTCAGCHSAARQQWHERSCSQAHHQWQVYCLAGTLLGVPDDSLGANPVLWRLMDRMQLAPRGSLDGVGSRRTRGRLDVTAGVVPDQAPTRRRQRAQTRRGGRLRGG